MLLVEPMDQDLGRQLFRLRLAVDRRTFLAGARHDLLELLRSHAARLAETEEVGVGRRGKERPLRTGRHADVLAFLARLAREVLARVGLERPEDHLERLRSEE